MPSGLAERYDFFLSRRGSVASIAQEVADVLKEQGYEVCVPLAHGRAFEANKLQAAA
jgi:hypothetical protein